MGRLDGASESLGRIFITALLLTRSSQRAEIAVLEGIRLCDVDDTQGGSLLRSTVTASMETRFDAPPENVEETSAILPVELQRVLHLPPNLRRCFVLRRLARLPSKICASLLRLDVRQIDESACAAAHMLASRVREEIAA